MTHPLRRDARRTRRRSSTPWGAPRVPRRAGLRRALDATHAARRPHHAPEGAPRRARRRAPARARAGHRADEHRRRDDQVAVANGRRRAGRDRPDAQPRTGDGVRLVAGRLRDGLHASARRVRPASSATSTAREIVEQVVRAQHAHDRSASRTSCSWAWASRSRTSITCARRSSGCTTTSGSRRVTSRSRRSGSCRACAASPQHDLPVTLAVSLHAPDDELRETLVPLNRRYPIAAVLDAAREYAAIKGRRVTFEYACIEGVNDHPEQADLLARRLRGLRGGAHVNLIPLNPTGDVRGPAARPGADQPLRGPSGRGRRDGHGPPQPRCRHRRRVRPTPGPRGRERGE